jgi:GNAT superfamily N-acetyltransferase
VRGARPDDYGAVVDLAEDTWPERGEDYIPRVYEEWMETEGDDRRTLVVDPVDEPGLAGIVRGVLLSDRKAWAHAMRVNPDYRGMGVSAKPTRGLFDWAAGAGASVCRNRNVVFSWNEAGLGQSRSVGFEPVTEFRWADPDPDPDAAVEGFEVTDDPAAGWTCYQGSDAAAHLRGLAPTPRSRGRSPSARSGGSAGPPTGRRASRSRTGASSGAAPPGPGVRHRDRRRRKRDPGGVRRRGLVGPGGRPGVFAAVARDAAGVGADRTRVLVPETPRHVSDAAFTRAGISDEPDFVLAKELAGW